MATFEEVVKQLQMNNRSEAGRDSRHTKMLGDLKTAIEGLTVATEEGNEPDSAEEENQKDEDKMVKFEVDSIELATPELSSNDLENNLLNQDNNNGNEEEPTIFENSSPEKETEIKEPEMFEESNSEEDFEIPAFLRRQKN